MTGQVLVSTRASTPGATLDTEFRKAQALAKAGELLPRAYREKPGAILLLQQWANARGIDTLTAMQTVSFIDGRPVVDATMQRAMAEREGVTVKPVATDRESATVEVYRNGELLGTTTYTMQDARDAGLANKQNWQKNPVDMLVARATTRAIRWYAPSVMLGTFTEDEAESFDDGPVDPTPVAEVAPAPAPDVVDAEVVEVVNPDAEAEPLTEPEFREMIKLAGTTQRETIEYARTVAAELGADSPGSIRHIAADPALSAHVAGLLLWAMAEKAESDPFGGES